LDECAYCIKHEDHSGKCKGKYNLVPCLLFERDPRGKRKFEDNIRLPVHFGMEIPQLLKDNNLYECGIFQIIDIRKIDWNINSKGLRGIVITANVRYWSEQCQFDFNKPPKLRLIKR
jgi:hypothetical protein